MSKPYSQFTGNEQLKAAAIRYCEIVGIDPSFELTDGELVWHSIAKEIAHHMAMHQAIADTEPTKDK